jgi:hypothetical protein
MGGKPVKYQHVFTLERDDGGIELISQIGPAENVFAYMEVRDHLYVGRTSTGGPLRQELRYQPKFDGVYGPMWGGVMDGEVCLRYESPEAYEILSR